jgi:site-specific recombinase XerD
MSYQIDANPQTCHLLSEAMEGFKLFARVEGRSPKTLQIYQVAFEDLLSTIRDLPANEVTPGDVRHWITAKLDRNFSKVTINLRLRAIRAFFSWLTREGHLKENPLVHVRQLRVPKQFPYMLTEEQARALITAAKERRHTWVGLRNYVMVATFIETMLRLNELINLEIADVSLQNSSIRVRHGKGDRERFVYMGRALLKRMAEWWTIRGNPIGEERVFITRQGNGLDPRNVQRILARLAKKAGLEGVRVSPHVLRHTGATFLARSVPIPILQMLLGHESIQTTMIYIHMSGTQIREAHVRNSSLDRLLRGYAN